MICIYKKTCSDQYKRNTCLLRIWWAGGAIDLLRKDRAQ